MSSGNAISPSSPGRSPLRDHSYVLEAVLCSGSSAVDVTSLHTGKWKKCGRRGPKRVDVSSYRPQLRILLEGGSDKGGGTTIKVSLKTHLREPLGNTPFWPLTGYVSYITQSYARSTMSSMKRDRLAGLSQPETDNAVLLPPGLRRDCLVCVRG
jgi:hypothetical protein